MSVHFGWADLAGIGWGFVCWAAFATVRRIRRKRGSPYRRWFDG